jgi:hypothetical protein
MLRSLRALPGALPGVPTFFPGFSWGRIQYALFCHCVSTLDQLFCHTSVTQILNGVLRTGLRIPHSSIYTADLNMTYKGHCAVGTLHNRMCHHLDMGSTVPLN